MEVLADGVRAVTLAGSGHFVAQEAPGPLARVLGEFFGEVDADGPSVGA